MKSKLTEITELKSAAELQTMSRQSIAWLKKQMNQVRNPSGIRRDMTKEKDRYRNPTNLGPNSKFMLGGLYFFYYNPKTRNDLPYYDVFPLVMPLEKYNDGFLALNFHYLPVRYRIMFMNKLLKRAIYDDNDEIKRVRITYEILAAAKRYKEFRPCLKRYLTSHIRSRVLAVKPEEWDVATMLPVHAFRKAPVTEVWSDSIEEIKNQ
jgi:hypothetical protein